MNKKIIFLVLLICLLTFVAIMSFGQPSSNVRWEYRTGTLHNANELGAQGWEAVSCTTYPGGHASIANILFKRQLP